MQMAATMTTEEMIVFEIFIEGLIRNGSVSEASIRVTRVKRLNDGGGDYQAGILNPAPRSVDVHRTTFGSNSKTFPCLGI